MSGVPLAQRKAVRDAENPEITGPGIQCLSQSRWTDVSMEIAKTRGLGGELDRVRQELRRAAVALEYSAPVLVTTDSEQTC